MIMNTIKKCLSIILSFAIILSVNAFSPIVSKAQNYSYAAEYSGNYSSSTPFKFNIYSINKNDNTFSGHIKIEDPLVNIDKDISGEIDLYDTSYKCTFRFSYFWFITTYDALFDVTVCPLTGEAVGNGGGGILLASVDFKLNGTVDKFYNRNLSYNEDDMKLCMAMSKEMYSADKESNIINNLSLLISNYDIDTLDAKIKAYNYTDKDDKDKPDSNKNNVAFALLNRKNSTDNSIDLFVVIRGTYKDEWQGNIQITGKSYNSEEMVHDNFNEAKNSIKDDVMAYYNNYCANKGFDKINLIITGHSRGAAVANLYAKEATDFMKSGAGDNIPEFNNVTAYTFACPNVEKVPTYITLDTTVNDMSSYDNIYNFWFNTDIVPTVPLTNPTEGWNYWKYGKCFTMDISEYKGLYLSVGNINFTMYVSNSLNTNIKSEMNTAFSQWPTVSDYYNKQLMVIEPVLTYHTTLYEFLNSATYFMTSSQQIWGLKALNLISSTPSLKPLLSFAISNLGTIYKSHDFNTYFNAICGYNGNGYGSSLFTPYTYYDALNNTAASEISINIVSLMDASTPNADSDDNNSTITYNSTETQKLVQFANTDSNNDALGWDLQDPSTWTGITWNDEGRVTNIDLKYKWLTGSLDCSGFTALETLNVYANSLTDIDLTDAINLKSLDCSYNNLSQNGLNLSDCTALTELYCDGCEINTLDLSGNTYLQTLSCAFNKLIALDIEDNTNLNHINCVYNYLDIHDGGTLYNKLTSYQSVNNAYTNYFPQLLPSNAVINTNELQALEDFANIGNNNLELDWLDDNGEISLDKLQNNALFEYDGEAYRIVALDISELNVEGALNLSAFTYLRYLYCNNTDISSLNISNCNSLEIIECSNCELNNLTLPSTISNSTSPLTFLNCENNHLDINIFTDNIINNINDDGEIKYRHQLINADSSQFYSDDYNALVNYANQRNNLNVLNWDLDNPGYWEQVNWKFDTTSNKYRLLDCDFSYLEIEGHIDLSGCDNLENYSFSGTYTNTAVLPSSKVCSRAFNDCKQLEAVIISNGAYAIEDYAFSNCPVLQGVYLPNSIASIGENAFENSPNVTIAGIENSYASTYSTNKNIQFIPGGFVCGNSIVKENNNGTYTKYYPVPGATVNCTSDSNIQNVTTDKYGYYVIFGLSNGRHSLTLSHPYGETVEFTTTINSNADIISTPIGIINFDWNKDNCIDQNDFELLNQRINSQETSIDDIYFDINCDGVINTDDWSIAENFLGQGYNQNNNN